MLSRLVTISLRHRWAVLVLACLVVVYGAYVTRHAKLDVFPDFVPPQVVIQAEAPGLSPEQVELLVTTPVERSVLGVGDIESVRSQSIQGLSIITVTFHDKTNVFTARQMLAERLAEVGATLPIGVAAPRMTPLTSATMDLYKLGLTVETASASAKPESPETRKSPPTPMELRSIADWTVRPRLLGIAGVANVTVYGGEVRQLQIQVLPDRLASFGLSIADVTAAAREATGIRGAGFIETSAQRIVLQTRGDALNAEQLGQAAVARRGEFIVRLTDVARVVDGVAPKFGDATLDGRPGIFMALLSQYGANTYEITKSVEEALDEMEPMLAREGIHLHRALFRPASFIEHALRNITHSLLLGAAFVAVVLVLFLWNLRTAFISLTAIPLSLLGAILVMDWLGYTLNTITLGGLAIALGEVVDDAIIDVENIYRRLRENAAIPAPRPAWRVVLDASLEVRQAVVYATFIVILVFVPVLSMSGLQGRLFAPLGMAFIFAVLASLAVALTVTPALSLLMLSRRRTDDRDPPPVAWLKSLYRRALALIAPHPLTVVGCVGVVIALTFILQRTLGGEFLPEFREGHFVAHMNAAPGTSLAGSARLGAQVARDMLQSPRIASVPQQIGRAELGEDPWGPHRSEFHINLKPGLTARDEVLAHEEIRNSLATMPGVTSEVTTFLGDRIGETISGETAAVVVSIFGDDLDEIDRKAQQVFRVLAEIDGVADPVLAAPPGTPQMMMELKPDRLRQYGLRPVEVLDTIEAAFGGVKVGQLYDRDRMHDIAVTLPPELRTEPEQIGDLRLRAADGSTVRLGQISEIYGRMGRFTLLHDNGRRRQIVTANVEGRDVASFVDELKEKVAEKVRFAAGTYVSFGGEAEARAQTERELLLYSGIAAAGIVTLLGVVLGNVPNLLLVLLNLPLALVGGVVAVRLTGGTVSIGGLVGFVTLFGISARNAIMLLSHYQHLVGVERRPWNLDTVLQGASERLVPILMTAAVTALGLLPIAVGSGEAGREIEGPMAIVIVGGLVSSTVLNLLVLPALALWFGRFRPSAADGDDAS